MQIDVDVLVGAVHTASCRALYEPELTERGDVSVHSLHVTAHPSRELPYRHFSGAKQLPHQRPAQHGEFAEQQVCRLEIQSLALVLRLT